MEPSSFRKIEKRQKEGTYRALRKPLTGIDFASNDYLGLAAQVSLPKQGSTGSRLITGNSSEAEACEHYLASFFGAEAALFFNSGYDANLGLLSSVATRHDTIIFDELIHASMRDGIRLSDAKSYAFRHQDLEDLERLIKKKGSGGDLFVAVEGLYSMDGDLAPLDEFQRLSEKYGFYLIVDEAHSAGVLGEEGRGLAASFRIEERVFARIVTFGKAYGTHGAVVLGSTALKNYLINFARPFIYSTAPSPQHYQHVMQQVQRAASGTMRDELQHIIAAYVSQTPFETCSSPQSPIQIIRATEAELKQQQMRWEANGIDVKLILPPTVPQGRACLRLCLHSFNTSDELRNLLEYCK